MNLLTQDEIVRKANAYWVSAVHDEDEEAPTPASTSLVCDECGDLADVVVEMAGVTICDVCCCRAVEQLKSWRVTRSGS